MSDKVVIGLTLDTRQFDKDLKNVENNLKDFSKKQRANTKLSLQVSLAHLQSDLAKARAEVRKYRKAGDKEAEIKASLKVQGLEASVKKAKKSLKSLDTSTSKTKKGFFQLNGVAKGLLQVIGIASVFRAIGVAVRYMTDAIKESVKAAIDFEHSFVGIRKTTTATEKEFKQLEKQFRALAKEIPLSVNELNRIGELGGQLGVAKDELVDFTKTIAAIGVSTNLSTEEAATALARIGNIYQKGAKDVDKYGASIVDLGNNFATTEKEITTFSTRIAGAGKVVGLSESDLFGIGTAFTSVGVQAEAGGTAVQKVLFGISNAANNGGESLNKFAKVSGMSAKEFKALWETDAAGAFTKFIEGLGKSGKYGQQVLGELGLEDQRLVRGFLAVAGAGDLMSRSISTANKAFVENKALTEEAGKFYADAKNQIQLYKNEVNDLRITFGNFYLKAILPFYKGMKNIVKGMNDFFSSSDRMKNFMTGLGVALFPVVLAFKGIVGGVKFLVSAFTGIVSVTVRMIELFGSLAIGIKDLVLQIPLATEAFHALGSVVGFVKDVIGAFADGIHAFADGIGELIDKIGDLSKSEEELAAKAVESQKKYIKSEYEKAIASGKTTDSILKDLKRESKARDKIVIEMKSAQGEEKKVLQERLAYQNLWVDEVTGLLIQAAKDSGDLGKAFSIAFAESSTTTEMLGKLKKAGIDVSDSALAGLLKNASEAGDIGTTHALLFAYGIEDEIPKAVETASDLKKWTIDALSLRRGELVQIGKNTRAAGRNYVAGIMNGLSEKTPALAKMIKAISNLLGATGRSLSKINKLMPNVAGIKTIASGLARSFDPVYAEIRNIDAAIAQLDTKQQDLDFGGAGGGGGKSKTDKEAEQAAKDLDEQQKAFNKTLEESQKIAEEASKSLESMYDEALDSIESALIKQDELTQSLSDYKAEADKKLTKTAATAELDDKEEIANIDEKIAKLKADLNDKDADSKSINEKIKDLQDEKKKIEDDLLSIQEYKNSLSEDELATIKQIQEVEERRKNAAGTFELAQIDTEEAKKAKEAEIQLEIDKQNKIIDIQNKFLELSKNTDEDVMKKKAELTEVLTATTKEEMEKRAQLLEELGFNELSAAEELELAKQIARQVEQQQIIGEQVNLQKTLLETKVEFLKKFEGKNKESLDVLKAQTDELINKYKEATAALRSLISAQATAAKDGYGLGGFAGAANKPSEPAGGTVTNTYYISTEKVDQDFLDNINSQGN